jgi:hypothetical protein
MQTKLLLILMVSIFLTGCKKEETYSMCYEVWAQSGNEANYSVKYIDNSTATVTTGVIDSAIWKSTLYQEVAKGFEARIEIVPESHLSERISLDVLILKNESVVAKLQIRNYASERVLSTRM